jgi:CBS domain-containing protein
MSDLVIKDIMNVDFAKVDESMPVVEASIELIRKEALGGPVVDKENNLLGWISEQECLKVTTQVAYHNERVATVKDIMRSDVLTVEAGQSVLSLAEKMIGTQPKNYPVVDEANKVVGVITRRRVLKSMLETIS